jgi:hypothetical protein
VSISATASSVSFNGDDVASQFTLPFRVLEDDDLLVRTTNDSGVTYTTLVLDDGFSLDGTGPDDGTGTSEEVTLTLLGGPLPTGTELVIERNTDLTQETTFQPQGQFSPITVSRMPDKLTLIVQELERRIAALESLGNLVDVTTVANGTRLTGTFTTNAAAVETGFPFNIACAGGANAKDLVARIFLNSDPSAAFDEPPVVQWKPGATANIVTILRISGLEPNTTYGYSMLVLF